MKNIIKDITNILRIVFVIWFFVFLHVYLKHGEITFLMLKGMLKGMVDYFIPYYFLPLVFFYFWGKNLNK